MKIIRTGYLVGPDLAYIRTGRVTAIKMVGDYSDTNTGVLYLCYERGAIAIYSSLKAESFWYAF